MIRDLSNNNNKIEIILANNHRYFTRSVVVSVINIVLLLIVTTGLAGFMILVFGMVAEENPTRASGLSLAVPILIGALYAVNAASFLYNLIHLKSMHSQISAIEDSALLEKSTENKTARTKGANAGFEEEYDLH